MDESRLPYVSTQWTLARKHIFYSEGTRQSLEAMRCESLNRAVTCIQASWRGSRVRRSQDVRPVHAALPTFSAAQSPRPSLPPLGERTDSVELSVLLYLSQLNGMDLNHWPPVPPPRQYSVCGNVKVPSPHLRTLRHHYTDRENGYVTLHTRDVVRVVGVSSQRGQLKVVHCGRTFHLPPSLPHASAAAHRHNRQCQLAVTCLRVKRMCACLYGYCARHCCYMCI
ncbi:uncharacterized protein [Littorina saxatilis]|uniref:uncharacterized protein n=1 Tax=Littorina saxatilis TaxID=31220 RepID=UPI0038B5C69E